MSVKVSSVQNLEPIVIDRPILLLVEGQDDAAVISVAVEAVGTEDSWQVHVMGGNRGHWTGFVRAALLDEWFQDHGRVVALFQDADDNPSGARQRCQAILRNCGLVVPADNSVAANGNLSTGIFIAPGEGKPGMLEDILIAAADKQRAAVARDYIARLDTAGFGPYSTRSKNIVQSIIAGHAKAIKTIPVAMNRATVFPINDEAFASVKNFVVELEAAV